MALCLVALGNLACLSGFQFPYFYLFIYFWLPWVFVAEQAFLKLQRGEQGLFSSCGTWASHCSSFSWCRAWAQQLWFLDSRAQAQ